MPPILAAYAHKLQLQEVYTHHIYKLDFLANIHVQLLDLNKHIGEIKMNESNHGGKRKGAGRKSNDIKSDRISVPSDISELLKRLGKIYLSSDEKTRKEIKSLLERF